jgi:hypothetical protein
MLYDVVSDSELTIDEWRGETGEIPARTFFAYVKFDGTQPDDQLRLLIDDVLWINGDDKETLKKYGFNPDEVANDYELYNEVEVWVPVITFPETTFRISVYDDEGIPQYREVERERFKQHLNQSENYRILAKVTVAGEYIFSVGEVYIP